MNAAMKPARRDAASVRALRARVRRCERACEKARAALSDLLMTRDPKVFRGALAALDAVLSEGKR